jgi:hypothetical protein
MYVDNDGDQILETMDELREFAQNTPCLLCSENAREMLMVLGKNKVVQLVFSTTCEHRSQR